MDTTTTSNSTASAGVADTRLTASKNRLASSQETFLTLLTAQLKNQDPLAPMDSTDFTAQLVQMTGVEQQLLTNELLQSLVGQSGGGLSNAVSLIGKTVASNADLAALSSGKATWHYEVDGNPSQVTLTITNSLDQPVWTGNASDLASGEHSFTWDGKTGAGRQLPDGDTYSLSISANDLSGNPLATSVSVRGTVTGVETVDGTTQVSVGKTRVPLSSIIKVEG